METAQSVGINAAKFAIMEYPSPHPAPGGGLVCYGLSEDCDHDNCQHCAQTFNFVDKWFPVQQRSYPLQCGPWKAIVAGVATIQLACYRL